MAYGVHPDDRSVLWSHRTTAARAPRSAAKGFFTR
jgi:hypothetical protein